MKRLLIIIAVAVVTALGIIFIQKGSTSVVNQSSTPSPKPTEIVKNAPLPQPEDIIRTFFALIDEKRIPEAVSMMSKINTENDSTKQAWGVQFNAIKSVKLLETKPYWQDQWSDEMQEYQVTLDMKLDPQSANVSIPYYGYQDGNNIRFIILKKENNLWKIDGIGTGP